MAVTFPITASLLFRQTTGPWYNGKNAPGSGSGGELSYDNMDYNWFNINSASYQTIQTIKGAAYTGSSNTFTQPNTFLSNVGISGSLSGSTAAFSGQVISRYPGVGFSGTASWAINVVNGGGSGSGNQNLQSVTTIGNQTTNEVIFLGGVTGSNFTGSYTGSLFGTSSWALNVVSSSYALTASYALNAGNAGSPLTGNATASFISSSTWNFNHNLSSSLVVIQTYDYDYNQIIPQNILLANSNSAVITFPQPTGGYAIASIGGNTGTSGTGSAGFPYTGSAEITGSLIVTGSISSTEGFTGSLQGTSSYAITASYALTASYVLTTTNVNYTYRLADDTTYNSGSPFPVFNQTPYNIYVSQSVSSSNILTLRFDVGSDGQMVNFTPVWEAYELDLAKINLVADTVYVYGLGGKAINPTSNSLADIFIGTGNTNNITFQFISASLKPNYNIGWYLINRNTI